MGSYIILMFCAWFLAAFTVRGAAPDYGAIQAIFSERCLDCHSSPQPEAKLLLESYETLKQGGQSGAVIVPGKSAESLLVKMIQGNVEKEGKKLIMPPGKRKKLTVEEIAVIRQWIDAGAMPPTVAEEVPKPLVVLAIQPQDSPRRPITALAYAPGPNLLAAGTYGDVVLRSATTQMILRTLPGHPGDVNALVFSSDGASLFAAAGEPARYGEVRQWRVADGKLVRTFRGHRDTLYALALAPDDKVLATGSYDQKIILWDVASGRQLRTLSGHNGAIFGLAFRPDGKLLASASADRTVKLWDVVTGERRDTLSQPLKEQYAVQFSGDGKRLLATGSDNRIRVWEISEQAKETTNPLLISQFAHEGAVLKLVSSSDGNWVATSADDKTVKIWQTSDLKELLSLPTQPDWPSALAFVANDKVLAVGRMDGTLGFYDSTTGKPVTAGKPEVVRLEPRGVQIGHSSRIKLVGKNLSAASILHFSSSKLTGSLLADGRREDEAWLQVQAAADLARGPYELWLSGPAGDTGQLKLFADDLPQVSLRDSPEPQPATPLPASFWGLHEKSGANETLALSAKAGQTLVFDVAARSLGSKAEAVLTLLDGRGRVLANDNGFETGLDPLLAYTFREDGQYSLRVSELVLGGSADHFYRLSIGTFAYVTACDPLSVAAGQESEVELIGYNLPADHRVKVKPAQTGEIDLPLDNAKFRTRKGFKILVSDLAEQREQEPNDLPSQATPIRVPGAVAGRIWSPQGNADADLFRFEAKAGQPWVIETMAAQRGSPADTKLEVLQPDGQPVERVRLQAVRDSAINFRPIDSTSTEARLDNWEEMELNQYLYLQGEVVKLFRAPQGPDSAFQFYSAAGRRRDYFDTSATVHALAEACYIVEPHPPGTKLAPNGLPAFPIYYANDDDAERKLGTDSKLYFTAPKDGTYLIRVTDTRGAQGVRYVYRLVVREPRPDFTVTLNGSAAMVNAGSGQSFSVSADRHDACEGPITVEISGLPAGWVASTPLVIQAGHTSASGTLCELPDAPPLLETNHPWGRITARATIGNKAVAKEVKPFKEIRLAAKPKLFVTLAPAAATTTTSHPQAATFTPADIYIAPGQTVSAWLKVKRNGYDDLITFTVENLPHGVIVDNIGLNGILIPKGESRREIFLSAAKWVPDTDRLCFAIENQVGRQTSLPVMLHVRRQVGQLSAMTR